MIDFKLTAEQRAEHKKQIEQLLKSTKRAGIDKLLQCMEENGYYSAHPHSHHKYEGGLAVHSLNVCKKALARSGSLPRESVIISALLHDICDIGGFEHVKGIHGRRSLGILKEIGLEMTDGECCAIRNHMHHENHPNPKKRISSKWDSVMADPNNKLLHELIYTWDKQDACHHNPFPKMISLKGGESFVFNC